MASEVPLLKPGGTLISFIYPAQNKALVDALAARRMTVLGECGRVAGRMGIGKGGMLSCGVVERGVDGMHVVVWAC